MNRAAKSIYFFGIYIILLGLVLVFLPNVLLKIFRVAETSEVWIRVVGMVVILLGYLYIRSALSTDDMQKFFKWTIHTRSSVIVFFTAFVLLDLVEPILILFGVFDLAGAIWTALALRTRTG
ncbi:hypothetical protein ACFLT9_11545 [Acidobacteriota bacterium]